MFRSIQIIFAALLLGQLIFAGVVYFLIQSGEFPPQAENGKLFANLILVVLAASVGAAWLLNQFLGSRAIQEGDLRLKLGRYQQRVLLRLALIEGGNLMGIILTLLTGNVQNLAYMVLGLAMFLLFRPNIGELARDYGLSTQEEEEVRR